MRIIKSVLLSLALLGWTPTGSAATPFQGNWQINLEETDKVSVTFKEGSGLKGGNFNPSISVMGLPLPSRSKAAPMSKLPAKDPEVLTCTHMRIEKTDTNIQLVYDKSRIETLRKGSYRGRTTTWSKKKIEQKYKTPERRVRKSWSIRKDDRLLVSVRIKPQGDKSRTYNRVFDRVEETVPDKQTAMQK